MSREVMQQALDALETWERMAPKTTACAIRIPSITALREALAQPEQEPTQANSDEVICPACCNQFRAIPVSVQHLMLDAGFEPPFTAPPAAQPREKNT